MANFTEITRIQIGDETVVIRRLTLKEVRECRGSFKGGAECLEEVYDRVIREHVTLADGSPVNPEDLNVEQMTTIVKELAGIPKGSGIADFIGLLC